MKNRDSRKMIASLDRDLANAELDPKTRSTYTLARARLRDAIAAEPVRPMQPVVDWLRDWALVIMIVASLMSIVIGLLTPDPKFAMIAMVTGVVMLAVAWVGSMIPSDPAME